MIRGLMGCLGKIAGWTGEGKPAPGDWRNSINKTVALTRVLQPAYTRIMKPDQPDPARHARPDLLNLHGATHTGRIRRQNEDSFSLLTAGGKILLVVADGMGGHEAGGAAGRIAVDAVCEFIRKSAEVSADLPALVAEAVQHANRAVWNEGMKRELDMGTTLSAALVADNTAYVAHVGDSRVYWIENGSIGQVTGDHSIVARLAAAGKITKQEARNHPHSNLLYRTIGGDEEVSVDRFSQTLKRGGVLLLCTDGLWGEVSDEDMHAVLASEQNMASACARLVKMANENGGRDNITVVAMKME